jgi:hypothetical protein
MAHTRDSKFASVCEPERMAEGDSMVERMETVQPFMVEQAVSPAPTFQDGMTEADDRRFLEATSGLHRYDLPRCFRCGHLLHTGECVNVAPSNAELSR